MNKKATTILVIVVLVALGYFLFKSNDSKEYVQPKVSNTQNTQATAPLEESPTVGAVVNTTVNVSTVKEFTVVGSSFAFSPSTISVNKGDKVRIIYKNSGGFHDFKIDEFNVATKKINSGEQDIVEFIANKAGSFPYYCSVGTHRAMGMVGTLTVK